MAEVREVPESNRYEIIVDGERAGLLDYVDSGDQRIFHHTEVDDKFSGQGLAGTLVSTALTETREAGKRIVPVCPYVARYVSRHQEFGDVVDPVTAEVKAAVEARQG